MKRYGLILTVVVSFILSLSIVAACAEEIKLAGGGTVESTIINPIKVPFEQATGHKIRFLKVGSKNAFIELLRNNVDASTADVSFKDLLTIIKEKGIDVGDSELYNYFEIGKDRMVFFIHKDNPVSSLSKEQLKGILTGKITNWKEVGGKDNLIVVALGKLSTASNEMIKKYILDGENFVTDFIDVNTSDDVKQVVASTPEAIGFGPIRMLDSTIKSPITLEIGRDLILVTKGKPSPNVQKLIDFIRGEGQKYIKN